MKYIFLIAGLFAGDGYLKKMADEKLFYGKEKGILNGRILLTKYHNRGAMLSKLKNRPEWVIRISCLMMGALFASMASLYGKEKRGLMKAGTAIMAGGALSNFYDRLKKGYVIDYFTINYGKLKNIIFNLSDMLIFAGGLLTIIGAFFEAEDS